MIAIGTHVRTKDGSVYGTLKSVQGSYSTIAAPWGDVERIRNGQIIALKRDDLDPDFYCLTCRQPHEECRCPGSMFS